MQAISIPLPIQAKTNYLSSSPKAQSFYPPKSKERPLTPRPTDAQSPFFSAFPDTKNTSVLKTKEIKLADDSNHETYFSSIVADDPSLAQTDTEESSQNNDAERSTNSSLNANTTSRSSSPGSAILSEPSNSTTGSPNLQPRTLSSPRNTPSKPPKKLRESQKQTEITEKSKASQQLYVKTKPEFLNISSLSLEALKKSSEAPPFLGYVPNDITFDIFFSYLTPEEKLEILPITEEFKEDMFFDYKTKQLSKEERFDPDVHIHEYKLADKIFFQIEEIFKDYTIKLQKKFFEEIKGCFNRMGSQTLYEELFQKILMENNKELALTLKNKISKEVEDLSTEELSNQLREEFFNALPPLLYFPDGVSEKLYNNLGIPPKAKNKIKHLIYEFITSIYLAQKEAHEPIVNTQSLRQVGVFGQQPELCDKIKEIFTDCDLPSLANIEDRSTLDFRIGFFVKRDMSFSSAVFGAILTNDFIFLDYVLNNSECKSVDIIRGVTNACGKFAQWVEVLTENYLSTKNTTISNQAKSIRANHSEYFLNSLHNARPYIKYAIYKAMAMNKKEKGEGKDPGFTNLTYKNFRSNFNKFTSAFSNKNKFIKEWTSFTKTEFKPSPLPDALKTYLWGWHDALTLKYRI